ncbi:MAG TPA: primosomal protein N' [Nitrospirota bacterium]|nr:primosomal protein N' [Nitrospirota bacterium]
MIKKDIYIDVAVGLGAKKTFTYSVPGHLAEKALAGQRVIVPLGKRAETGFIVGRTGGPAGGFEVREVLDIPDDAPLVPEPLMRLTRWAASYYHFPWGQVLSMALPPGIEEGRPARPRNAVREPGAAFDNTAGITLNDAQKVAVGAVTGALGAGRFGVFLLHGATGSGKTEVYLRVIEALGGAKGAVLLVPEISLTPQLVRRFSARFGDAVAVLHSGLTESQRRLEWHRIRKGEASVVVGARSAVFAPFEKLGIIIVDEEHDSSYKQEEGVRYSARDVAVMRAKLEGCPAVLGSATPSLESYHNARSGKYALLELPERAAGRPMPEVRVVDLKDYPGAQLSPPLVEAAATRLGRGEQALFFLNRRGYSDFLLCRDCGHVPQCPNCSISQTYHRRDTTLRCHWCGQEQGPPEVCPKCGGSRIKYMGGGTEKLERELGRLFPDDRITRVDRDTVRERDGYRKLLDEVATGESRILLGTQMVAKGHDLPGIGLVGVVMADYGLHHPDFRAAERTFQTVTQVAGRCGRGDVPGEVIVQTYQPEHYSLVHASKHDFCSFYEEEIKLRRELGYPPFSRLALAVVKGVKQEKAKAGADAALKHFKAAAKAAAGAGGGVEILGPAPAPVKKARGKYRYFLVLKSASSKRLHEVIEAGLKSLEENKALPACTIEVDVDPQSMV